MNMLERAARAIATADERNGGPPYEYRVQKKHAKEMLFDEVRAVLAAIREPDERMLRAFDRMTDEHGQCLVKTGYAAMIDAILEGESK